MKLLFWCFVFLRTISGPFFVLNDVAIYTVIPRYKSRNLIGRKWGFDGDISRVCKMWSACKFASENQGRWNNIRVLLLLTILSRTAKEGENGGDRARN